MPHFSTFSKNYERRFGETDLFNKIFTKILGIAESEGLIAPEQIYIDSTHIKASANKKKYEKVNVNVEAKKYQKQLDKESGMFHKNEKEKCFAYLAHTACDDSNFILGFEVTAGNVHDSVAFEDVFNKVKERYEAEIAAVAVDAGYKTPYISRLLLESDILPSMPYKRPMTKDGFFKNMTMFMMSIMIATYALITK